MRQQETTSRTQQKRMPKEELSKVWVSYKKSGSADLKEVLIKEYLPLVRYIAERVSERLPKNVQVDDLISTGVFGLMEAIDRFDLSRGIKFESYCVRRIEGSMLDELRNMDWVPRITRQKMNKLEDAYTKLERKLNRTPTDGELAKALNISLSELTELYQDVNASTLFPLQKSSDNDENSVGMEIMEDRKSKNPFSEVAKADLIEFVKKHLSTKEKYVMMLYYYDELTMKEIGQVLGLSESRVSQIHAKLLLKVRSYMKRKLDPQEIMGE